MDCLENEFIIKRKPQLNFAVFFMKEIAYKTHLFLLLMSSEVTALCSFGEGWYFLNNGLVTGKGIKYFENAAKEMGIFWGGDCFYPQKRRNIVPSSLFK